MTARIVLFGATGFTGRLTAEALVAHGAGPLLAGRSLEKLDQLGRQLNADLEVRVASADDPATVQELVSEGDVLVSTVGPFTLHGRAALEAALTRGAHYIDSTGEPGFIREVFAEHERALAKRCVLLTAFGYDYVPGHAAAGAAIERATKNVGDAAAVVRVDVGYFWEGSGSGGMSEGTRNSSRIAAMHPGMEFHDGRLIERFGALDVRSFILDGESRDTISVGGSEHYALPRSYASLRDVNVYLGWFGKRSKAMSRVSRAVAAVRRVPVLGKLPEKLASTGLHSEGRGPDASARQTGRSRIVAIAYDSADRELASAELVGANGYDYTAGMLAWGAMHLADHPPTVHGARGPIEVFGLEGLLRGCAAAGLHLRDG